MIQKFPLSKKFKALYKKTYGLTPDHGEKTDDAIYALYLELFEKPSEQITRDGSMKKVGNI